ncbi:MAG: 7-carboxy-7-deazaguanine synthase QueE [Bacteroidales bacterium]|jgi:organic radical activating enzyme|nr:7-carboxy-7-deazaguanine synthase QueE [Bacteroidales bacterium]
MDKVQEISPDGLELPLVEEFFTIQGEGYHSGEAAWFIRLGGCDVGCNWCDSRFSWDPAMHPLVPTEKIVEHALGSGSGSVIVTGGEPLMWNLDLLCNGLKNAGLRTFIETSGAYRLSGSWDWICLSPKKNMPPKGDICLKADELKVIIENRDDFEWAEKYRNLVGPRCRLYLQPEWSRFRTVIPEIVSYVKENPAWKISLQIHKYMHIP